VGWLLAHGQPGALDRPAHHLTILPIFSFYKDFVEKLEKLPTYGKFVCQ
jgi:hypothetical protein